MRFAIGVLIIVNVIVLTAVWILNGNPHKTWAFAFCLLCIFLAHQFVFPDRNVKFNVLKGSLESTLQRAEADADEIAKIKKRINSQSATIDLAVERASRALKTVAELETKTQRAEANLQKTQKALATAERNLKSVDTLLSFQTLVTRAQNDDREAFDEIVKWQRAEGNTIPMQDLLDTVRIHLRLEHITQLRTGITFKNFRWKEDADPSTLSLAQIASDFSNEKATWLGQPGAVVYIWNRDDFEKEDRIKFLIDVLKEWRSLKAVNLAGKFLTEEAKIEWQPFFIEPFVEWWENKKKE